MKLQLCKVCGWEGYFPEQRDIEKKDAAGYTIKSSIFLCCDCNNEIKMQK